MFVQKAQETVTDPSAYNYTYLLSYTTNSKYYARRMCERDRTHSNSSSLSERNRTSEVRIVGEKSTFRNRGLRLLIILTTP
jgi:hypothetical protein